MGARILLYANEDGTAAKYCPPKSVFDKRVKFSIDCCGDPWGYAWTPCDDISPRGPFRGVKAQYYDDKGNLRTCWGCSGYFMATSCMYCESGECVDDDWRLCNEDGAHGKPLYRDVETIDFYFYPLAWDSSDNPQCSGEVTANDCPSGTTFPPSVPNFLTQTLKFTVYVNYSWFDDATQQIKWSTVAHSETYEEEHDLSGGNWSDDHSGCDKSKGNIKITIKIVRSSTAGQPPTITFED